MSKTTNSSSVSAAGPGWVHEIKHDGYRLIVRRDGEMVRLFTRRGYDWTDRYPGIAVTASRLRAKSFTLDGEAAVCGADGVAVFDALHRRRRATDAVRPARTQRRRSSAAATQEAQGEAGKAAGAYQRRIALNEHMEGDGAIVFPQACATNSQRPALLLDSFPENHKRQLRCSSANAKI
jgi:hypothetical protein